MSETSNDSWVTEKDMLKMRIDRISELEAENKLVKDKRRKTFEDIKQVRKDCMFHKEQHYRIARKYKELESELEDWRDGYRRVTEEGPRHDEKHCSCAVDLWKRNGELEAKIKELEAEKEELEGPHTIEHEWTHEQFNSMFEKLSMMAVRISDKEVKKITMTCESDSQEVKWCATCNKEQSK